MIHTHYKSVRRKRSALTLAALAAVCVGCLHVYRATVHRPSRYPMMPLVEQERDLETDFDVLARTPNLARATLGGEKMYWGARDHKTIALTFDDGPHPKMVGRILAILGRNHVRATFFVVGQSALAHPDLVRAEVAAGHQVSNHTFHHARMNMVLPSLAEPEIAACDAAISRITHRRADAYFRPPGGEVNPNLMDVCRRLGKTVVMYSDDPQDFKNLGEDVLLQRLLANAKPGGIILLHDNVKQTIHILPTLIASLKARGYTFVTISQLDAARKPSTAPVRTAFVERAS
ncbi:MAG TPA: polysaccharide deacetylase family protein [Armatimonadota bacterium]